MTKRNWFNTLGLSKHISLRGFALIFLALTQVPIAIKKTVLNFPLPAFIKFKLISLISKIIVNNKG